jgi:hypothetical protein
VGDTDVAARTVGVNARGSDTPRRDVPLDEFADAVVDEVERKGLPERPASAG